MSEPINEIATALAKAQAEMSNPRFDSKNPAFKSRFASFAAVRNAIVPVLAKHGICVTQDLTVTEIGVACRTVLTHSSGQQMPFGPLVIPVLKKDAWGYGSAGTYAKRYSLQAIGVVAGDEDDDANASVGGEGERDPRAEVVDEGHEFSRIDHNKAREYADRFRKALVDGNEDLIYELHQELNPSAMFYVLVSTKLTAAERTSLKDSVHKVHSQRKALSANGGHA